MSFRTAFSLAAVGFGLIAGTAAPAFAHSAVIDTSPAAKALVSEVTEVSVTANEELLDIGKNAKGFVLAVKDSDGAFYGDGCVSVDGDTATMPVKLALRGKYTVSYRVVSNDGHPVEGKFTFEFAGNPDETNLVRYSERPECGKTPVVLVDETLEPTEPTGAPTDEPAAEVESFDLAPWIGLATIPVIIGAIWILVRMLGSRDSEDHLE